MSKRPPITWVTHYPSDPWEQDVTLNNDYTLPINILNVTYVNGMDPFCLVYDLPLLNKGIGFYEPILGSNTKSGYSDQSGKSKEEYFKIDQDKLFQQRKKAFSKKFLNNNLFYKRLSIDYLKDYLK